MIYRYFLTMNPRKQYKGQLVFTFLMEKNI